MRKHFDIEISIDFKKIISIDISTDMYKEMIKK